MTDSVVFVLHDQVIDQAHDNVLRAYEPLRRRLRFTPFTAESRIRESVSRRINNAVFRPIHFALLEEL